ncbi:MAG: efflux RND transporter periplasmic adaptor subunit [Dokdonia sp.]|jgi:RND family efflux transporter MFP subunit|nr:efflux transporter periplasmic adaptor subunit [Cytophagaceae bacterium]
MKNLFSLLVLVIVLISCGGNPGDTPSVDSLIESGDLQAIKAKKEALKSEVANLSSQIASLDAVLKKKDTTGKEALVTTITLNDTLFKHYVEVQGSVETKQNVLIYPEYQGMLTSVYVKKGDRVAKGQTLARIDDGGLSSQLAQLETQAALAKTTFERQQRLWDQKIGSEIQYLQTKTQYEASQNAVNQLKSQLAKTNVSAPFSGVIDEIITEQGTVVSPGQALFRIVNLSNMYVAAEVPESYLATITPGKEVDVYLPVLGEMLRSKIRETGNYINPANRTYTIEVDVPNKDGAVKPNLSARLSINDYTAENSILIPLNVINENADGDQYVYTASAKANTDNQMIASRQVIKVGKTQGDMIEVLEGLNTGDQVIAEGARSVKDKQEIKIIN